MLPPPRFSRIRRPLLALLPGAPPELWRYSRATLRQLRANARDSNCAVLAWTINSDFSVPAVQWPLQRLYLACGLAAAHTLRVSLLRVNLGGSVQTPYKRDGVIMRRLAEFVRYSQQCYPGISITVDNHWGISTNIDRHIRIVDDVFARLEPALRTRFGCCFDPANMPQGKERRRWWRELAKRANHYHLKTSTFDACGCDNSLPHGALFALLDKATYRANVTIEYAGNGDATEGVKQSARFYYKYWTR